VVNGINLHCNMIRFVVSALAMAPWSSMFPMWSVTNLTGSL
jgi:hypothetical protein